MCIQITETVFLKIDYVPNLVSYNLDVNINKHFRKQYFLMLFLVIRIRNRGTLL